VNLNANNNNNNNNNNKIRVPGEYETEMAGDSGNTCTTHKLVRIRNKGLRVGVAIHQELLTQKGHKHGKYICIVMSRARGFLWRWKKGC
jgi:hypothetical protein